MVSEIIVSFMPEGVFSKCIIFTVPQRGDKKKLLDLSVQNVPSSTQLLALEAADRVAFFTDA